MGSTVLQGWVIILQFKAVPREFLAREDLWAAMRLYRALVFITNFSLLHGTAQGHHHV